MLPCFEAAAAPARMRQFRLRLLPRTISQLYPYSSLQRLYNAVKIKIFK